MQLRWALAAAILTGSLLQASGATAGNPCTAAADSAQDLRSSGKLREARAVLLVCVQKTCNAVIRSDCEKWLKEVDEQTPSVVLRATDSRGKDVLGIHATIDEAVVQTEGLPVQIDPGQHDIRVQAKSGAVAEQKVRIALGEKNRVIELKFKEPLESNGSKAAASSGTPVTEPTTPKDKDPDQPITPKKSDGPGPLPFVLAGVGVVSLGAFTYFEISGHDGYANLENGCDRTANRCSAAQVDDVKQQFVLAGITLGIGAAALAAAAISYFALKPSSSSASSKTTAWLRNGKFVF